MTIIPTTFIPATLIPATLIPTSMRLVLAALVVACSTHGALAGDGASVAQSYASASTDHRASVHARARLCNGISKHTRTICCGTNPPAWCGKRPQENYETNVDAGATNDHELARPYQDDFGSPLRDPMFYVCMFVSVTVIYLTALAGSGRDSGVDEAA
jgi:hypothetical protein